RSVRRKPCHEPRIGVCPRQRLVLLKLNRPPSERRRKRPEGFQRDPLAGQHIQEEVAAKPADQVGDTPHGAGDDRVLLAGERAQLWKLDHASLDGSHIWVGEQALAHWCQLGLDLVAESLCPHLNRLVAGSGWRRFSNLVSSSGSPRPFL